MRARAQSLGQGAGPFQVQGKGVRSPHSLLGSGGTTTCAPKPFDGLWMWRCPGGAHPPPPQLFLYSIALVLSTQPGQDHTLEVGDGQEPAWVS